jgi:hypothetical protein
VYGFVENAPVWRYDASGLTPVPFTTEYGEPYLKKGVQIIGAGNNQGMFMCTYYVCAKKTWKDVTCQTWIIGVMPLCECEVTTKETATHPPGPLNVPLDPAFDPCKSLSSGELNPAGDWLSECESWWNNADNIPPPPPVVW